MIELLVILAVGGLGYAFGRGVLEREQAQKPSSTTNPNLVQFPVPGVPPVPANPALPTAAPPEWPSDAPSPAECDALMASMPPEGRRKLLEGAVMATDAQWANIKADLTAKGQGKMAGCLDAARVFAKKMMAGGY